MVHAHAYMRIALCPGRGRLTGVVCALVWGIGLRRLGCVCGRRSGTGSSVSIRQTTTVVVRGLGRAFLCLSVRRGTSSKNLEGPRLVRSEKMLDALALFQ